MTSEPAVEAIQLSKSYGDFVAVAGIDFRIESGEAFGFLGPNGAGKTTTMRMIYRASPVGAGQLRVFGLSADGSQDREIKRRLGVVPQLDNLDEQLTVRENLSVFCRFYGVRGSQARARIDELLDFADLGHKADAKVEQLSGGMRRRLLIARGLIHEPELVVLDEPTTGLDPRAREKLWSRLAALRERNATLVLTTHYMREAERLCDRVAIMDGGHIVSVGPPPKLIAENVPPFAVEISRRPLDGTQSRLSVDGALTPAGRQLLDLAVRHDEQRDRFVLYCDDPEHVVGFATHELPNHATLMRPSSLEDVFLTLTGHSLDE